MNRKILGSDTNPYHILQNDEVNFSRLKIILLFPFVAGFAGYFINRLGLTSPPPVPSFSQFPPPSAPVDQLFSVSPMSSVSVFSGFKQILSSLLLDFSLVICFLLAVFNVPKRKDLFNKIAIFLWLSSIITGVMDSFGFFFLFELTVSVMLLNLFILLEPLSTILVNTSILLALQINFRQGSFRQMPGFEDFSTAERLIMFLIAVFVMVALSFLSIIRYKERSKSLDEKDLIQEQNRKLEDAARLRDHIDRIVRHDMKNPLTGMIGLSRLLRDSSLQDKESRLYIDMIEQNGNRLIRLLDNSLDLYKMEQYTYIPKRSEFDLGQLIAETVLSFTDSLTNRNLNIVQLPPYTDQTDTNIMLNAERDKISHMLSNLVQNAIEASPPDKEITITVAQSDTETVLTIHNYGVVPEEIRSNLFQKYVTAGKTHGTGLGTHSARMIVLAHNGTITFTTDEKEGTTFSITLPKEDA